MLHITAHYAPHTTTLHHHSCITSSHSTSHNGNIPHHSSILIHQSHIPHHMVTHSTPHHILNHTTLHIHSTSQKHDITQFLRCGKSWCSNTFHISSHIPHRTSCTTQHSTCTIPYHKHMTHRTTSHMFITSHSTYAPLLATSPHCT